MHPLCRAAHMRLPWAAPSCSTRAAPLAALLLRSPPAGFPPYCRSLQATPPATDSGPLAVRAVAALLPAGVGLRCAGACKDRKGELAGRGTLSLGRPPTAADGAAAQRPLAAANSWRTANSPSPLPIAAAQLNPPPRCLPSPCRSSADTPSPPPPLAAAQPTFLSLPLPFPLPQVS